MLDPAGAPLPAGEIGEIWMRRGSGLPAPYRYLGAEARTTGDGWESVGDMGSIDAEGYVYLADRTSDMLIVGGANVYPAEVESALMEHPAVRPRWSSRCPTRTSARCRTRCWSSRAR